MEKTTWKVIVDYKSLPYGQLPKTAEMRGTVTLAVLKGGSYIVCNYLPQC